MCFLDRTPPVELLVQVYHTKIVSNNIVVMRYAESPHMTLIFQVVSKYPVYTNMAYRKETTMRAWRCNLPFVSSILL